eukprot:TRINITY_DN13762_c0_g1_i1.p1 TRINITY_DN13762_c0_g1~~TRINITY_DN13762_c0_g1_i1.p1  ORF type:complete len:182 (+),score=62.90 TRINITY_DN13762_c0_g1_i1:93-638(+)
MIRRPPRSTLSSSSAASDVYKRQIKNNGTEINKLKEKHAEAAKSDAFISMIQLNPDNFYNRAVVLECFAQYGSAASDYETAARLDPTGLRAAITKAKICTDIVHRFKTLTNDAVVVDSAAEKPVTICATATTVSYTHLRAHETPEHLVCRLLLEKKKTKNKSSPKNKITLNNTQHLTDVHT